MANEQTLHSRHLHCRMYISSKFLYTSFCLEQDSNVFQMYYWIIVSYSFSPGVVPTYSPTIKIVQLYSKLSNIQTHLLFIEVACQVHNQVKEYLLQLDRLVSKQSRHQGTVIPARSSREAKTSIQVPWFEVTRLHYVLGSRPTCCAAKAYGRSHLNPPLPL